VSPSIRRAWFVALVLLAVPAAAQHGTPPHAPAAGPPPLYEGLGDWSHRVTATPEAQRYFDQGLRLTYAFNHEEAIRAFREAARLDPGCAMAWWGVALAAGPNINLPMDDQHARVALDAIERARTLRVGVSPAERDYIDALARRYSADPAASRGGLDSAYANAMRDLARRYPRDADAAVLCAEALLDLSPWNQWTPEGKPRPGTREILGILERVMRRHPMHPGANHYYVHAIEASPEPARGLGAARRLEQAVRNTGHLVHMPSHIYVRTGHFADVLRVNRRAVEVDEAYLAAQKPTGAYPIMYYTHNIHFVWFGACMEGRRAEALEAARKLAAYVTPEAVAAMPMVEIFPPVPLFTHLRFGRWDDALAEPEPAEGLPYTRAVRRFARGLARAARGERAEAAAELARLRDAIAAMPADRPLGTNLAVRVLAVAERVLEGEIARREDRHDDAVRALRAAAAAEDALNFDEPPDWFAPVRHLLGAALLDAGRPREAEAVYRADLARFPENGWSLAGLARALEALGRTKEAAATRGRFEKAWAGADTASPGSAF
jgi:tetratricopeptide (TPR) repeat protein